MKFNRIKHTLLRLSIEEKALSIGGITVLIGSFLPWYKEAFKYSETTTIYNGFAGEMGVIGFTVFFITLIALLFLASKHFNFPLPHFGYKKDRLILYLMGQSAFLLLLTLAIYTKKGIDSTNAEISFGLYVSLMGACISAFATFAQIQKKENENTREMFHEFKENAHHHKVEVKDHKAPAIQRQQELFDEEVSSDQHYEHSANQGSYFLREAGVDNESNIDTED